MGWASTYEDIVERITDAKRHLEKGFRNLEFQARSAPPPTVNDMETLRAGVSKFIADMESQAVSILGEAQRRLQDTGVQLVARLEKRETQLKDARETIAALTQQLQSCRTSQRRIESQLRLLNEQHIRLSQDKAQLNDQLARVASHFADKRAWEEVTKDFKKK